MIHNEFDTDNSPETDINDQALAVRAPDTGLTGNAVKIIAIVSMLIDHIGYALVLPYMRYVASTGNTELFEHLKILYRVMRGIGRLAFPLFCFFLVEGMLYTRSRIKYAARLAVFGVISELPFDLAFYQRYRADNHNNVFLTLLIGLIMVWIFQEIKERFKEDAVILRYFLCLVVLAAAMLAAWASRCDYTYSGILCIASFWFLRQDRQWATTVGVGWLILLSSSMEVVALVDIPVLMNYNGKRGAKSLKYFFYLFYPLHLLLMALIARATGIVVWQ